MGRTVVEKAVEAHAVDPPRDRPIRPGDLVELRPRRLLTHDNTSAIMARFSAWGGRRPVDPGQLVIALDHDIQNGSAANLAKYAAVEAFARKHGIEFHPPGSGIGHQLMVERLHALPGTLVVAADSHANMYGALGALGTPVVRTDAVSIWGTATFFWEVPPTAQVVLTGALPSGATGKDVILALCAVYPDDVLNHAVEFSGPGIASLDIDARLTIANMTTEWGAMTGWFPIDVATLDWIRARVLALGALGAARVTDGDLARWASAPPAPDPDASYAKRIVLDLGEIRALVSGPDTTSDAAPLATHEPRSIPIQKAYIVSCVNGRASDLESAARELAGRRVAPGVELYVAPASAESRQDAERSGAWRTLLEAGAIPLPAGCGPCIGLGAGLLEAGETGISATNRNFRGRMGSPEARCYLASPAVVAASAAAGHITGPTALVNAPQTGAVLPRRRVAIASPERDRPRVPPIEGFPRRVAGRPVFLLADAIDTDRIIPGRLVYRDDASDVLLAASLFANFDAKLATRLTPGDIVVAGERFGTGSSREQAATAFVAAGIRVVVAASFSATWRRNARNAGLLAIEAPALVVSVRRSAPVSAVATSVWIPDQSLVLSFDRGEALWDGSRFPIETPQILDQTLFLEGGIEGRLRRELSGRS